MQYKVLIEARVRVPCYVEADDLAEAAVKAERQTLARRVRMHIWNRHVEVLGEPKVVEVKR